jgi:Putative sensor
MPTVDDMTTTHVATAEPAPVGRLLRRLGIDTQYVLLGLPLGIITVVLCMTGFWLGVGLSIIWIGLPILLAVTYLSRERSSSVAPASAARGCCRAR